MEFYNLLLLKWRPPTGPPRVDSSSQFQLMQNSFSHNCRVAWCSRRCLNMKQEVILILTRAPLWMEKIIRWPPHAEHNPCAKIRVTEANMWQHPLFISYLLSEIWQCHLSNFVLGTFKRQKGAWGFYQGTNFLGNHPNVFILSAFVPAS